MRLLAVSSIGLCMLAVGGCSSGGSGSSAHNVTVQLDVTSTSPSVSWSGTVNSAETTVNVQGTTPSSQRVQVRVHPSSCDTFASSCPQIGILASITAFPPGPATAPAVGFPLTVCLTDLDSGNRNCMTSQGIVIVQVDT